MKFETTKMSDAEGACEIETTKMSDAEGAHEI